MLEIMTRYDLDGNNQLDLSEFLMLVRDTPAAPPTPSCAGRQPSEISSSSTMRAAAASTARAISAAVFLALAEATAAAVSASSYGTVLSDEATPAPSAVPPRPRAIAP